MQSICLMCGEPIFFSKKRFCSKKCADKMYQKSPLNLKDDYNIFKNMVERCDTWEEFAPLFLQYFGGIYENNRDRSNK